MLSFDRIARRINPLYPTEKKQLDSMGKALIISDILSKSNLKYYKSAAELPGFVNVCNEEISELKSYMITPQMLKTALDKTDDAALSLKLAEISIIEEETGEKPILLLAVATSFFAIAAEIVGTSAVAKAIFKTSFKRKQCRYK